MAIAMLNGWSIAEALAEVCVCDELFHIHEIHVAGADATDGTG
jgi:hypothetical protein